MKQLVTSLLLFFICISSFTQVPVSKEPRHKVVFENSKVRVLNVLLPPADTTFYHVHSTPSVFVFFTKTNTASQLLNGNSTSGYSVPGNIYYEDLYTHQRIHRVWNIDTTTFHVMDVELLTKDTGFVTPPLQANNTSLLFTQPMVRGYKVELQKNSTTTIKSNGNHFLLVAIQQNNATVNLGNQQPVNTFKEGAFLWINPSEDISISNNDNMSSFALFELK